MCPCSVQLLPPQSYINRCEPVCVFVGVYSTRVHRVAVGKFLTQYSLHGTRHTVLETRDWLMHYILMLN